MARPQPGQKAAASGINAAQSGQEMGMNSSGRPRRSVFLATVLANAINLESMTGGCVVMSASDLLLQLLHFPGKEFHRTAAFGADHVVMAPPVVLMLIAGNAIVESDFAG